MALMQTDMDPAAFWVCALGLRVSGLGFGVCQRFEFEGLFRLWSSLILSMPLQNPCKTLLPTSCYESS